MLVLVLAFANILWQDPGDISKLDLGGSIGWNVQVPKPPFRFVREDPSGTQLKLFVRDANGTEWNVKFGYEVKPEAFAWRLVKASGYFAEPNFFVGEGRIEGIRTLRRHENTLKPDGQFTNARFQYRDPSYRFQKRSWLWRRNPFLGTPELAGLKMLIMLFSNWDNKDGGDAGPNTAIFQHGNDFIYTFTDWGSGMGSWGDRSGQTDWRCDSYTMQSTPFCKVDEPTFIHFAYEGHHKDDFQTGIRPADAAWLMQYLGRISDDQLRSALRAAGANPTEEACFAKAVRTRIEALRVAAGAGSK